MEIHGETEHGTPHRFMKFFRKHQTTFYNGAWHDLYDMIEHMLPSSQMRVVRIRWRKMGKVPYPNEQEPNVSIHESQAKISVTKDDRRR